MIEVWRPVVGREGFYEVSSCGRVRSMDRTISLRSRWGHTIRQFRAGRMLKSWADCNGYPTIYLCGDGSRDATNVHRIVASAFCEMRAGCNDVNHKNGVKADNSESNLEWVTRKENMAHAMATGLADKRKRIKATSILTGESTMFDSATDAARAFGTEHKNGNISSAANGKLKQAYGHHWAYV